MPTILVTPSTMIVSVGAESGPFVLGVDGDNFTFPKTVTITSEDTGCEIVCYSSAEEFPDNPDESGFGSVEYGGGEPGITSFLFTVTPSVANNSMELAVTNNSGWTNPGHLVIQVPGAPAGEDWSTFSAAFVSGTSVGGLEPGAEVHFRVLKAPSAAAAISLNNAEFVMIADDNGEVTVDLVHGWTYAMWLGDLGRHVSFVADGELSTGGLPALVES